MEGKGREREKRVRVEFRVIVEDEVRADYRAAHTSFLPPSSRKITTARGKEGGGGSSRQGIEGEITPARGTRLGRVA